MAARVNVGVIGCGLTGIQHVRAYRKIPNVRFVGVYDLDTTRAIDIARRFGGNAFGSMQDLLRSIDAVSIATPPRIHEDVALAAIDHDCHVLIEKPLADSLDGANRILDRASRDQQRIYMAAQAERFNPAFVALKRLVEGRTIRSMTLRRMSLFGSSALDTDVINDLMIDDIDLVLRLLGDDIISIDAVGTPVRTTFIDQAMAELSIGCDVQVNIIASRVANRQVHGMEVRGDGYRIIADLIGRTVQVVLEETDDLPRRVNMVPVIESELLDLELRHFVNCIQGQQILESDLRSGYRAMAIAGCIHDIVRRNSDANPDLMVANLAD